MLKLEFLHYKMISHLYKSGEKGDNNRPVKVTSAVISELETDGYIEIIEGRRRLTEEGRKAYFSKMESSEAYVSEYAKCTTHQDRAELERMMMDDLALTLEQVTEKLNTNFYEVRARNYIHMYGPQMAWDLLDKKSYSVAQVRELVQQARKFSIADSSPTSSTMEKIFSKLHDELVANASVATSMKDRVVFRKKPSPKSVPPSDQLNSDKTWNEITKLVGQVLERDLDEVDPIEKNTILVDFKVDLDNIIRLYKIRIKRVGQNGIKLPESEDIPRNQVVKACKLLDVKVPKIGNPPDMDDARRKFRKRAGIYHPDRNPGNNHTTQLFQETNQAYELLVKYVESLKG